MENEKPDFPFKVPRLVKILGIVVFIIAMTIYMLYQRDKNIRDGEFFYRADISGVIQKVGQGSGGWHPIYLADGRIFRFCPHGSYIEKQIDKGDTIFKPSMSDTVFIRNNSKQIKITFLK